jgi:hypothetical protein
MTTHELEHHNPFEVPEDPSVVSWPVKARIAFELRKVGASYEEIADKLGYANAGSAEAAIRKRLKDSYKPDDVETVVTMELERLDALQLIAWRRARQGDLAAIDRILKIMERRSQYLGLDRKQPTGDTTTVTQTAIFIGGSEEEYVAQLQQAREQAVKALEGGT